MTLPYAAISDPTNPFNKTGLSLENRALLRYVEDAKGDMAAAFVVTCTTDHGLMTAAGNLSRHRQQGTDGEGLAIDGRMKTRGTTPGLHLPFFNAFAKVEKQLHELIYAYAPYNIKAGKRVAPFAVASHKDHVHVAVNRGVFVQYPLPEIRPPVVSPPYYTPAIYRNTLNGVPVRSFAARIPTDAQGDGGIVLCSVDKFIAASSSAVHDKYGTTGDTDSIVVPVGQREEAGMVRLTVAGGPPSTDVYSWVTVAD